MNYAAMWFSLSVVFTFGIHFWYLNSIKEAIEDLNITLKHKDFLCECE